MQQQIIDTWNGYTNYQTPQEFMDISREKGYATIEEAVDAYVKEIAADWMAQGMDTLNLAADLREYLATTQGEEWQ